MSYTPAHRGGGGGGGGTGDTFKGPHEAFIFMIFTIMSCIFTLFLYLSHYLDSMSKSLGRIISACNAFTASVDKLFDACKRALN